MAERKLTDKNRLSITNPELVSQWHPTKNGDLTPHDISRGSERKVWWICSRENDHVWDAIINSRARGNGCPYCSNRKVSKSNKLSTFYPKLCEEWNINKNNKNPDEYTIGSQDKVWWICQRNNEHEWITSIYERIKGKSCPICAGQKVHHSNCLETVFPLITQQWHPIKNGTLTPKDVTSKSNKKVWWLCEKGVDHEWYVQVHKRSNGYGCPVCTGQKVVKSNCLEQIRPDIAEQWHPNKNKGLTPDKIGWCSSKKIWWKCDKGDDHEWEATVAHRVNNRNCPICSGKKVVSSNSLFTIHPNLSNEWDYEKNGNLTPNQVTIGSDKNVWWNCSADKNHSWRAIIGDRVRGNGCPFCKFIHHSRQELVICFELKHIFHSIEPKGKRFRIENKIVDVDIYISELNLIIEFDGNYWHKNKELNDFEKSIFLQKKGYNIIRLRQYPLEKLNNTDIVFEERYNPKQLVNKVLSEILDTNRYPLSINYEDKILEYLKKDNLVNSENLLQYLQKIAQKKENTQLSIW